MRLPVLKSKPGNGSCLTQGIIFALMHLMGSALNPEPLRKVAACSERVGALNRVVEAPLVDKTWPRLTAASDISGSSMARADRMAFESTVICTYRSSTTFEYLHIEVEEPLNSETSIVMPEFLSCACYTLRQTLLILTQSLVWSGKHHYW